MAEMRLVSTMFCHLPPFERVGIVVYQQVLTALQLLLSIHDGLLRLVVLEIDFVLTEELNLLTDHAWVHAPLGKPMISLCFVAM